MQGPAHPGRVLHVGEDPERRAMSARLDAAYDALMATTRRHFGHRGDGHHFSGVAGLDTPTMNRAVIEDAPAERAGVILPEAAAFFQERALPWSAVLSVHSAPGWHAQLIAHGFTVSSSLSVLARDPGRLPPSHVEANIRSVRPDEVGAFTEMLIDVFSMPRRFFPALSEMTEAWQQHGAKLYFAQVEGEPVATALLVELDGVAGIYNVGTRRHARRRGLARVLMERAFDDAQDADVVTLQVAPGSVAEAFYLRLGFERAHAWRFYAPGPRAGALMTRWYESPG